MAGEEEGRFLGEKDSGLVIRQGDPQETTAITLMLPQPWHPWLRIKQDENVPH